MLLSSRTLATEYTSLDSGYYQLNWVIGCLIHLRIYEEGSRFRKASTANRAQDEPKALKGIQETPGLMSESTYKEWLALWTDITSALKVYQQREAWGDWERLGISADEVSRHDHEMAEECLEVMTRLDTTTRRTTSSDGDGAVRSISFSDDLFIVLAEFLTEEEKARFPRLARRGGQGDAPIEQRRAKANVHGLSGSTHTPEQRASVTILQSEATMGKRIKEPSQVADTVSDVDVAALTADYRLREGVDEAMGAFNSIVASVPFNSTERYKFHMGPLTRNP